MIEHITDGYRMPVLSAPTKATTMSGHLQRPPDVKKPPTDGRVLLSMHQAWQEATGAKRLTVKLFGSLEPQVEGGGTGAAADFTPAFAMCGGRMMKPTGS